MKKKTNNKKVVGWKTVMLSLPIHEGEDGKAFDERFIEAFRQRSERIEIQHAQKLDIDKLKGGNWKTDPIAVPPGDYSADDLAELLKKAGAKVGIKSYIKEGVPHFDTEPRRRR